MNIQPIRNDADHEKALRRLEALMDAQSGTAAGDELDVLTTLVERYEQGRYPIDAPDPVEFLKQVLEFRGLGQNALAEVLNSRSRASEILNRRRPLSLEQVRRITSAWQIPADPLIAEYELVSGQ